MYADGIVYEDDSILSAGLEGTYLWWSISLMQASYQFSQ
jgi:hypothetical protein